MRTVSQLVVAACALLFPAAAWSDVSEITFSVTRQNRSLVPCVGAGSGAARIAATLITPEQPTTSVTLYLHGLGFGQWFWHFDAVGGLDYVAELAKANHASVIIDRLGYGATLPQLDGNQSCIGVQADIADQIAKQLRSQYHFSKVAIAGHSAGGAIAQVAAYSFPQDFDALIVMSYADQGASADTLAAFLQGGGECLTSSSHYGHFGQSAEDFDHLMFNTPRAVTGQLPVIDSGPTADTASIVPAATSMRELDPCGDYNSIPFEIVLSQVLLSQIQKPVLLVCGDRDAVFPPPACDLQALHFLANPDFTYLPVAGAGHAITLGTTAAAFRAAMSSWLADRSF